MQVKNLFCKPKNEYVTRLKLFFLKSKKGGAQTSGKPRTVTKRVSGRLQESALVFLFGNIFLLYRFFNITSIKPLYYVIDDGGNHYGPGLSIAKSIADAHKGEISVDCKGGKVIFEVSLKTV